MADDVIRLHLMARDTKRMRYVVVIGTENLSIQPVLLSHLTDRLRRRLAQEIETAWQRPYVADCIVVSVADFSTALPGCFSPPYCTVTSAPRVLGLRRRPALLHRALLHRAPLHRVPAPSRGTPAPAP